MIKRVLLYFALLLWFVVPVTAQPTIFVEDTSVDPLENIEIEVKVADFENIGSMQFSVNWDPAFLQFDSVSVGATPVLPDYSNASIGQTMTAQGKLGTLWFEQNLNTITLADSTAIFKIFFAVLATEGSSEVSITDDPIDIELSDGANPVTTLVESGTVTVLEPNSTDDLRVQSNHAFTLFQNEPNPFVNQTVVRFEVYQPSDFTLEVYDSKGAIIFSQSDYYLNGNHAITIDEKLMPVEGIYFYKLKTKDYFITNRMILVRK